MQDDTEIWKRLAVKCSADVEEAVEGVRYIADKIKSEDEDETVSIGVIHTLFIKSFYKIILQ